MAPELIEIQGKSPLSYHKVRLDGKKCDVYSAAIMFAEMAQPRVDIYEVGILSDRGPSRCDAAAGLTHPCFVRLLNATRFLFRAWA